MNVFKTRFEGRHKRTGNAKNGTVMKRTCTLLALFSCLLLSPAVRAQQDTYTLKDDDVQVAGGAITFYQWYERSYNHSQHTAWGSNHRHWEICL